MPFFKVTTDEGKIWVLEWSGVGSILEYIAEFEDADRAKRYIELENQAAGLIEGDVSPLQLRRPPGNENVPKPEARSDEKSASTLLDPTRFVSPRRMAATSRGVAGAGNLRVIEGKREAGKERAVAGLLAHLASMADPQGYIEISLANLAHFCGMTPGAVARYIKVLVERQRISVVRPGDHTGPAIYRIIDDIPAVNETREVGA